MRKAGMGLLALIYTSLAVAGPDVIIPSKAIDNLFYLYKNYSIANGEVNVTGQSFTRVGPNTLSHNETGHKDKIPLKSFIFYRYLGASVFRALSGTGTASGTASLIGKNLVLTNKHVLATDNTKKSCGKFAVYLDDTEQTPVTCKEVLYCDVQDFCLAEMNQKEGKDLSDIVRPIALKSTEEKASKKLLIVGNANGLGIQGSSGKEYVYLKKGDLAYGYLWDENILVHHTPTLSGSSGSPIFNEQGEMVGLNYANDSRKGFVDENAHNLAVPSTYILQQLKKNISASAFNSILTDKKISQETISEYEDNFQDVINFERDLKIEDTLIVDALKKNTIAGINLAVLEQVEYLRPQLTLFSEREKTHLMILSARPEIQHINQANKLLDDWFLKDAANKHCATNKDLTRECRQDFVIAKLENNNKLIDSLMDSVQRDIVQARLNFPKTTAHDILNAVRDNKALAIGVYKDCMKEVKKLVRSSGTIYYNDSSSVYYRNSTCLNILMNSIRATGLRWTDDIGPQEEAASLIGSNLDISQYEMSFEKMVGEKWLYGLLGKSGTKAEKVESNKKAIADWVKTLPANQNSEEWFEIINPKMRKSIL